MPQLVSPDQSTQTYNERQAHLAAWFADNCTDLPSGFAEWVGDTVSELLADETGNYNAASGHLFCGLIGAAAIGLIQYANLSKQLGDAIAKELEGQGVPPLAAQLVGLLVKRISDVALNLQVKQLAVALCAVAIATCPDQLPAKHGNPDITQCQAHLAGAALTADLKERLGISEQ